MNEILVSENTSVREAFKVMEVVSLYGAIICALKERHHKSGELCSREASQSRSDVCYDSAPKRLSCRHREAHIVLFLFLVFCSCLSSTGRILTLLWFAGEGGGKSVGVCPMSSGRALLICACERMQSWLDISSEGSLSLSEVSWGTHVPPIALWTCC